MITVLEGWLEHDGKWTHWIEGTGSDVLLYERDCKDPNISDFHKQVGGCMKIYDIPEDEYRSKVDAYNRRRKMRVIR